VIHHARTELGDVAEIAYFQPFGHVASLFLESKKG
jgi:hypothetical protein